MISLEHATIIQKGPIAGNEASIDNWKVQSITFEDDDARQRQDDKHNQNSLNEHFVLTYSAKGIYNEG